MNPYKILGVDKFAELPQIKRAFQFLAKELHPGRGGDEARAKDMNAAWAILRDEKLRDDYDKYGTSVSEDKLREKAEGLFKELCKRALSSRKIDLVANLSIALLRLQREHEAGTDDTLRRVEYNKKVLGRTKRRSGVNVFDALILEEQAALEAHQETLKEGKAVLVLLNEMIGSYSTVFDPVEQETLQLGCFKPLQLEN